MYNGQTTYYNDDREKVEIFFSARNLKNKDQMSKTDPIFLLYQKEKVNSNWIEIHRTEQINDNLNPDFTKSFVMDFIFERHQFLKIECRDIDNASGTKFDTLGHCEFELGNLMGSHKNMLIIPLLNKKGVKQGDAIIRSEKVSKENFSVSDLEYLRLIQGMEGWFESI